MAILTADQLVQLRHDLAASVVIITWNKTQANSAFQAIEDWFENNRTVLALTIDTNTAPFTFTSVQKVRLIAFWLKQKFIREGI